MNSLKQHCALDDKLAAKAWRLGSSALPEKGSMEHKGAWSRPRENTASTFRSSPEVDMMFVVGFDVVAAVDERSYLSCTCISVAQWGHQRKY
jgi:hypothetical protein